MLAKLMSYFLRGLIRVLTGAQARWYGCPPKVEQRIYFANHQSHADLMMIWAALHKELRARDRSAEEAPLEPLFEALSHGDSIILFPEGTRGSTEEPQPFKAGLYNLACKFPGVELVPAWINNVQRVMPKGEVVPVLCSVTFGAPVHLQEGEERRAFLERARRAVIALRDV